MESVNKKETAGESERAKTCEQLGWSGKAPVVDTEAKKEIKFKYRRTVEATLLIVIAVAIWGLFSLPSLLYLKRNVANKVSPTLSNTSCTPILYAGNASLCHSFLLQYKSCNANLNDTDGVYISSNINVNESERIASQLNILQYILSPKCRNVGLPFICLYLFPPCDWNGTEYLPTSEQCRSISTDICKNEWTLAQNMINGLPDCASLPNMTACNKSIVVPSLPERGQNIINCSENFILSGNYCLPSCPNWTLRTGSIFTDDYMVLVAAIIGVISGTLFFVVSCLRYSRMFVFPSILVVCQTAVCLLLAIFAIINSIDPKVLYCSGPDWISTLKSPSTFCSIAGSVLYWCLIQIAVLWMLHVCTIFWTVRYPVHYMTFKGSNHMKYIFILMAAVAIIVPAIVIIVAFQTGGFVNNRFPPVLCSSRSADAAFFSIVLPISIITPSGVSLLLIVFWTLQKKHGGLEVNRQSKGPMALGTAEIKVLIIFFYYLILGSIVLASIELSARKNNTAVTSLGLYFACESIAPGNCERFRNDALQNTYRSLTNTSFILLALFPLVNLVYAINFSSLKNLCSLVLRVKKASDKGRLTSVAMTEHN